MAVYVKTSKESNFIYADQVGRIVMVEAEVNNRKTLLVAIYVPNEAQEMFYKRFYNLLMEKNYQSICLIGDFNAIVDQTKDYKKNHKGKAKEGYCLKYFSKWQKSWGWKILGVDIMEKNYNIHFI